MKTPAAVMIIAALSMGLFASPAGADVTINIGPPPPPIVVSAPPKVVIVPGTPVYYAPAASNLFVYGGSYYSLHNGQWFYAKKPGAAWVFVPNDRVPRPIIGVPVSYYKIPPGHMKKMDDHDDGNGKGGKKGKGH